MSELTPISRRKSSIEDEVSKVVTAYLFRRSSGRGRQRTEEFALSIGKDAHAARKAAGLGGEWERVFEIEGTPHAVVSVRSEIAAWLQVTQA